MFTKTGLIYQGIAQRRRTGILMVTATLTRGEFWVISVRMVIITGTVRETVGTRFSETPTGTQT